MLYEVITGSDLALPAGAPPLPVRAAASRPYGATLILEAMLLKVPETLVPRLVTAVTMAAAIRAAIRPYSRAVAPSSLRT